MSSFQHQQHANEFDLCLKYIIIGDSSCGKSCIMTQFLQGKFPENQQQTIGVEFGSKIIEIGKDKRVKLQLWDTSGSETYNSVCSSYYRNAVGALLTYDITNAESFKNIQKWLHDAKELAGPSIICILVGNKKDLEEERQVPFLKASEYAQQNGLAFFETSAKTGYHITDVITCLTKSIVYKFEEGDASKRELKKRISHSTKSEQHINLNESSSQSQQAASSWCWGSEGTCGRM